MSEPLIGRRPLAGLTSLRFFAALYVLLFHTRGGVLFRAGYTGVTLFFVLSGFILAYNHPVVRSGEKFRFYVSRFARIYPLYLVSFVAMLPYFLLREGSHVGKDYIAKSCFLYLTLLQTWFPPYHFTISPGSWTLSVETFFYLVFPIAVDWLGKFKSRWRAMIFLLWACLLIPPVIADLLWIRTHAADEALIHSILFMPIFHLGEFLIGIVLGLRYLDHRPTFKGSTVFAALLLCIIFLAAIGFFPSSDNDIALNGMMALPFGFLIYSIAGWPSRLLAHPLLQIGGEISYGIYLLQWVFVDLVQRLFHHSRTWLPVRFGLFLVLAYVTYLCIEKPARRLILRFFKVKSHPKPIETTGVALP